MTISNANINPYPTSNPLTSRHIGNNNIMWNQTGFKRCSQSAKVPYSKPFSIEDFQRQQQSLEVPCQNQIPMGAEGKMAMMPQYNSDIFQCPDGTIISISTGKIIKDNLNNQNQSGEKMRWVKSPSEKTWNDNEIMNLIPHNQNEVGLSKSDIEYSRISEIQNKKLKDNMSDLQKNLLADLENGNILKKSHFVEEK